MQIYGSIDHPKLHFCKYNNKERQRRITPHSGIVIITYLHSFREAKFRPVNYTRRSFRTKLKLGDSLYCVIRYSVVSSTKQQQPHISSSFLISPKVGRHTKEEEGEGNVTPGRFLLKCSKIRILQKGHNKIRNLFSYIATEERRTLQAKLNQIPRKLFKVTPHKLFHYNLGIKK